MYANGTNVLKYRSFLSSANTWGPERNVFEVAPSTASVEWVELAVQAGNNQIGLAYSDANSDLHAVLWDGIQWREGTKTTLETGLETRNAKAFDIAFETLSGRMLATLGDAGLEGLSYATLGLDGSWSSVTDTVVSDRGEARWVWLKPDPRSDRIAMVRHTDESDGNDNAEMGIWEGDGFSFFSKANDNIGTYDRADVMVEIEWLDPSGKAVMVYNYQDVSDRIYTSVYTPGSGWSSSIEFFTGINRRESHDMVSIFGEDRIVMALAEDDSELWTSVHDGSSWSELGTNPQTSSLPINDGRAFSLGVREPHRMVVGEPKVAATDAFNESGSIDDGALIAFRLYSHALGNRTVDQIAINIDTSSGISIGDLSDFKLVVDENLNSVVYAGDTTTVGGTGSLSFFGSAGEILFTTDISISTPKNLILTGDVANLVAGDSMTISVDANDVIDSAGAVVVGETTPVIHIEGVLGPNAAGDTRMLYARSGSSSLGTRLWDQSEKSLSLEFDGPSTTYPVQWAISTIDPNSTTEFLAAQTTDGSSTQIEVLHFDGSDWVTDWTDSGISNDFRTYRGFDMATMSRSGNTLVVYANGSTTQASENLPMYRLWDGSSWSGELPVFSTEPSGNAVVWVDMASQPGTDEVALLYSDDNKDLHGVIWDGNSWKEAESEVTFSTDLDKRYHKSFALAYESISGELLVVFGENNTPGFTWTTKGRNSYSFSSNINQTFGSGSDTRYISDDTSHMELGADPSSDFIAYVGESDFSDDYDNAIWTGTRWSDYYNRDDGIEDPNGQWSELPFDAAWLAESQKAITLKREGDDDFETYIWNRFGSWSGKSVATVVGMGREHGMRAVSIPHEDGVLAMYIDSSKTWAAHLDSPDVAWEILNDREPIHPNSGSTTGVPFSMTVKYPKTVILASPSGNQGIDAFAENNGESAAELMGVEIKPFQGNSLTITELVYRLNNITGITGADLANTKLIIDANANGVIDGGETSAVGGTPSVTISGETGTITFSTSISITRSAEYILVSDVNGLEGGDRLDVSLATSDVTVQDGRAIGAVMGVTHREQGGASPFENGDGRLVFGTLESPAELVRSKVYIQATADFSEESAVGSGSDRLRYIRNAISPSDPLEELVVAYTQSTNFMQLDTFRFDGSAWTHEWQRTMDGTSNDDFRVFDLAHESQSGNALVVYGDGSTALRYRHYNTNTNTWGGEANVLTSGDNYQFVQLATNAGNNQIALATSDSQEDLFLGIWRDDAWAAIESPETNLNSPSNWSFGVAVEQQSGNVLAVWGPDSGTEIDYGVLEYGAGSWSYTSENQSSDEIEQMVIAADPSSDPIIVVYRSDQTDLETGIWDDGFTWSQRDSNMEAVATGQMKVAAGWMGTTGTAFFMYDDDKTDDKGPRYWRWTPTGGYSGAHFWPIDSVDTQNITVHTQRNFDGVVIFHVDQEERVDALRMYYAPDSSGGFIREHLNDAMPIFGDIPVTNGVPWDFAERDGPQLLLADHPSGQALDAFGDSGSATGAKLFAFQLTPSVGTVTVSELAFTVSSNNGLGDGDFANLAIYTDADNDGLVEGGDTSVAGAGTVSLAAGNISFTGDFSVSAASSFILQGDFASLSEFDALSIALASANIRPTASNVPVSGTVADAIHYESATSLFAEEDIRLVYTQEGSQDVYSKVYVSANSTWTGQVVLGPAGDNIRAIEHAIHPEGNQEFLGVLSWKDNNSGNIPDLDLLHFDGSTWAQAWTWNTSDRGIRREDVVERPFAVAYESVSGHGLAVAANTHAYDDGQIEYYTLSDNTWTYQNYVFDSPVFTEDPLWIDLIPHPDRDEITMLYSTFDRLGAIVWDGTQWLESTTENLLNPSTAQYDTQYSFHGAYESLSGDFLVVWVYDNTVEGLQYATRSDGSATWSTNGNYSYSTAGSFPNTIRLIPDPASDRVAILMYEGSDTEPAMWTGTSMVGGIDIDDRGSATGQSDRSMDGAWLGDSGTFVFTVNGRDESNTTDEFSWGTWTAQAGYRMKTKPTNVVVDDPNSNYMFGLDQLDKALLVVNQWEGGDRKIYSYITDGVTWTPLNGQSPIVENMEVYDTDAHHWDAVMRKGPRLVLADHVVGSSVDAFLEAGSVADTALLAFRLKPTRQAIIPVSELSFTLSNVVGIDAGDITDLKLYVDADDDGVLEGTDATQVGGGGYREYRSTRWNHHLYWRLHRVFRQQLLPARRCRRSRRWRWSDHPIAKRWHRRRSCSPRSHIRNLSPRRNLFACRQWGHPSRLHRRR